MREFFREMWDTGAWFPLSVLSVLLLFFVVFLVDISREDEVYERIQVTLYEKSKDGSERYKAVFLHEGGEFTVEPVSPKIYYTVPKGQKLVVVKKRTKWLGMGQGRVVEVLP